MKRYNPKDIEPKWQKIWEETGIYTADLNSDKPKYIAMSMFNYPSGAGIHIGHAMNYTISDVKARFKRQQGFESYHPVGWDSFGLPAENYAIKAGVSPQESMGIIIPSYHHQYKAMGWSNDWEKEIAAHQPEYYKWSQWIFSEMYRNGLAYQDARMQWWCSKCQTVLANEQVIDGKCWRHDASDDPQVEKKEVKQWFFKITDYADELLESIDDLDWTESVKLAQKNWIGRSKGVEIDFQTLSASHLNFVILHGYTGRADKNFIPSLKHKLEKLGYKVQAPQLPNTDHPIEDEQVEHVLKNCNFDSNTVMVGHSLGGAVAMKVLERLPHKIQKLVLVAPVIEPAFRPKDYEKTRTFVNTFNLTYDYSLIQKKAKQKVILSDTLEKLDRHKYLEYLAPKVSAKLLITTAKRKHFTANEEPAILSAVLPEPITVFTTRADTIFSAAFLLLAPEHPLVDEIAINSQFAKKIQDYRRKTSLKSEVERQQVDKEKTGVFTGVYAINPANNEKIPVWIADFVLAGYGTGAVFADIHDERDFDFIKKFDIDARVTLVPDNPTEAEKVKAKEYAFTEEGILIDSGDFSGLRSEIARPKIVKWLEGKGAAKEKVNYRMRDWSVSRQRYWGAPIPIVYCEKCGPVLVPDEQLPVELPILDDFQPGGDGRSALARAKDWLEVACPECGGKAERETDTLDTYICSSWYMYRYFDPHNQEAIFDSKVVKKWEPIDFYNGADHATAHLLYARFIGHFFKKLGLVNEPEPFKQFLFNGKVTAQDGTMFSKSKGNGVDPLEIIDQGYGADALRLYLMFAAPLDQWIRWDPQGVPGAYRFLARLWTLVQEYDQANMAKPDEQTVKKLLTSQNKSVQKIANDLETNNFNTAIATMMAWLNELYKLKTKNLCKHKIWKESLESIVACVAPFAPHTAEELWHILGHSTSVNSDSWPVINSDYLIDDRIIIIVQINGKVRANFEVATEQSETEIVKHAKEIEKIKSFVSGRPIRKTIYIPQKLVNFVI